MASRGIDTAEIRRGVGATPYGLDPEMLTFLDPTEEATFARQGYVVRRALDQQQVDAALKVIEDWSRTHYGTDLNHLPFQLTPGHYTSAVEAAAPIRDDLANRLGAVVNDSLRSGTSGASPYGAGISLKMAYGARVILHRHTPMLLDPFARHVLTWCSLVDCDQENGCLFIIPRSHSLYRKIDILGEPPFFGGYIDELVEKHAIPVPLRAGEAVYFDNLLLHGSYPNRRPTARPAILSMFLHDINDWVSCRRGSDGDVEFVDDPYETRLLFEPGGEDGTTRRRESKVLKRLPAWNRKATLRELEVLLMSDLRPSEDFDPLEFLCGPETPPKITRSLVAKRNPVADAVTRALPAAVKRPLRRIFDGWKLRRVGKHSADHR